MRAEGSRTRGGLRLTWSICVWLFVLSLIGLLGGCLSDGDRESRNVLRSHESPQPAQGLRVATDGSARISNCVAALDPDLALIWGEGAPDIIERFHPHAEAMTLSQPDCRTKPIQTAVERKRSSIRNCFWGQVLSGAELAAEGLVVIHWRREQERLLDLEIVGSTLGSAKVERCVLRILKRVRVSKSRDACAIGETTVRFWLSERPAW